MPTRKKVAARSRAAASATQRNKTGRSAAGKTTAARTGAGSKTTKGTGTRGTGTKRTGTTSTGAKTGGDKAAGISSAAVKKATGRTWAQWISLLDRAGAMKMAHKEIAALLADRHDLSGWWSQMVTVGYEQQRQGRRKHEKADGFEIGRSKTLPIGLSASYAWFADKRKRARWLAEPIVVRKATREKSMRITWPDETHVDVYFYDKGAGKSQVAIQHKKLASAREAERCKAAWTDRLNALKAAATGG